MRASTVASANTATPVVDDFSATVEPGVGTVLRTAEVVLAIPMVAPGQESAAGRLLGCCREQRSGTEIPRRIAALLAAEEPAGVPGFGVLLATGAGLTVAVRGDVDAVLNGDRAGALSGRGAILWRERLIDQPVDSLRFHPAGAEGLPTGSDPGQDLLRGEVPGAGVVLRPFPPFTTVVEGAICPRGHFTDPVNRYCTGCGTAMPSRSTGTFVRQRPPLGVLRQDDGTEHMLDGDYVLGREPGGHEAVVAGRARPLRLNDAVNGVSRVHASVSIEEWRVSLTDLGSANGTYLRSTDGEWRRLAPGETAPLPVGSRMRIGERRIEVGPLPDGAIETVETIYSVEPFVQIPEPGVPR